MKSVHFETYQQGSMWWAISREAPSTDVFSGETEAAALLALCEHLYERAADAMTQRWELGA